MSSTSNVSHDNGKLIEAPAAFAAAAHVKNFAEYQKMYRQSIDSPETFWADIAGQFHWQKKWDKVTDWSFRDNVHIKWFIGGKTNIAYNALDRHLDKLGDRVAIHWEGNDPAEQQAITYKQMHEQVCRFANTLKSLGVKKGDRVCLYMQMIPQLPVAMLACARIGAIHSVVFGAFSEDALRDRIND
ncbi:MAG: AMP-binding protein, partial [Phycisphaeraceae bacterium]